MCSSTRRFFARPVAVVLGATGCFSPMPTESACLSLTPRETSTLRTASARRGGGGGGPPRALPPRRGGAPCSPPPPRKPPPSPPPPPRRYESCSLKLSLPVESV